MSLSELDRLIGTALADPLVCAHLLDSHRRDVIASFDLTAEERLALLSIQADTLQDFARQLFEWLNQRKSQK
jgi:hypothetical protein